MGQRANLIIVRYGEYELFCSHWVANALAVKILTLYEIQKRTLHINMAITDAEASSSCLAIN